MPRAECVGAGSSQLVLSVMPRGCGCWSIPCRHGSVWRILAFGGRVQRDVWPSEGRAGAPHADLDGARVLLRPRVLLRCWWWGVPAESGAAELCRGLCRGWRTRSEAPLEPMRWWSRCGSVTGNLGSGAFLCSDLWGCMGGEGGCCCPGNELGWLQAASSARGKQCCLERRPAAPAPPRPPEPLFAARGRLTSLCVVFPPAGKRQLPPFPVPRATSFLLPWGRRCQRGPSCSAWPDALAGGCVHQGAAGIYSCRRCYWWGGRGGGGHFVSGGRKELVWAVASCNCNGLWKTSTRSFLFALYPGP